MPTAKKSTGVSASKRKLSVSQKGAIAVAATAALAAGALFIYGKQDAKTKKKIKSWGLKAKAEVMDKLEKAKELNKETYETIVEQVGSKYAALKNVDQEEVGAMIKDMKKHWGAIRKSIEAPKGK